MENLGLVLLIGSYPLLILAAYRVWRKEHSKVLELQSLYKLQDLRWRIHKLDENDEGFRKLLAALVIQSGIPLKIYETSLGMVGPTTVLHIYNDKWNRVVEVWITETVERQGASCAPGKECPPGL